MKNFTKKIRRKSIIALLFMFLVTSLLSVAFTMSKYVIEKPVGNLTLNLTSVDTLMPGLQLRNTLGTSVTEVVFGKTDDYESEIVGIEPTNVDLKKTGKIKLYVKGTKAYILSNRKIYAHPNSFHTFFELKELTSVDFSNFETRMVTNMRGMFRGCDKLTEVKNVTSWNTKNVEDMEFLFRGCSSLTTLDLSGWNTAKVKIFTERSTAAAVLLRLTFRNGIPPPLRISSPLSRVAANSLRLTFRNGIPIKSRRCAMHSTIVLP